MKITLRQRPSKSTNKIALYLEFYKGYKKTEDGKVKHEREYEYLEYFLYNNPKTANERQHNKENSKYAEAVYAKRLLEHQNDQYGFVNRSKLEANFIDYFRKLTDSRKDSSGNYGNWDSALKHLISYSGERVTFKDVTLDYLEGFKEYLQKKAKSKTGISLSQNTSLSYFNKLRASINQAFEDGIITENPVRRVKGIKAGETHREYLTEDELKAVVKVDCRYDNLKRAFLFSCLTGIRWSDIQKLKWSELQEHNGGTRIQFHQKKTKNAEYLDISKQARKLLGEAGNKDQRVFEGMKYSAYMNTALSQWMLKAGITKHITFHCARHTFATLQLTLGTDIYTVSKLLGHSELKTTEIYTKVIDQKKTDAVNRMPDLSL